MKIGDISFKRLLVKVISTFILCYSVVLLVTTLSPFTAYILQTVVFGIPVWISIGALTPYLVYYIILPSIKTIRHDLFLIKPSNNNPKSMFNVFLLSIDTSLNPTLFALGILNLIFNYFDFIFELGIILFVYTLVFVLGIVIPIITVVKDSDLVIFNVSERMIQPFGAKLQSYFRGISGFTAIFGLLYNILLLSGDVFLAINIFLLVLALTYPAIFAINFVYSLVHPLFVRNLNRLLSKRLKKCKVIVKVNDKDGDFVIAENKM